MYPRCTASPSTLTQSHFQSGYVHIQFKSCVHVLRKTPSNRGAINALSTLQYGEVWRIIYGIH